MFVKLCIISFLLVAVVYCETTVKETTVAANTTVKPTTKPSTHVTNTTIKPTTKPSTHVTNTTIKPTTKPSTHVTNTTIKPTTKPSTHVTNTTVKPTTQPSPPAPNSHPKVTLNVQSDNKTCVMMVGEFLVGIPYTMKDGKTNTTHVGIQNDAKVTGSCNTSETMHITFKGINIAIMFGKDSDHIWWKEVNTTVDLTVDPTLFPKAQNASLNFTATGQEAFKASNKGSYMCNSDITNTFGGVSIETWNFQYTAYQVDVKTFSKDDVSECTEDAKTNSIVPIAVGAALAGLVVIVLIAYLIGRRRNRKGYESV